MQSRRYMLEQDQVDQSLVPRNAEMIALAPDQQAEQATYDIFIDYLRQPEMTRLGQEARWLGQEVGKLRDVEVVTKAGAMADKVVDAPDRQRTPPPRTCSHDRVFIGYGAAAADFRSRVIQGSARPGRSYQTQSRPSRTRAAVAGCSALELGGVAVGGRAIG